MMFAVAGLLLLFLLLSGETVTAEQIQNLKPAIFINGSDVTDGNFSITLNQTIVLCCRVTQNSSKTGSGVIFRWYKWSITGWRYWGTEPVDRCAQTDVVADTLYCCNMTALVTTETRFRCSTEGSSALQSNNKSVVGVRLDRGSEENVAPKISINGEHVADGIYNIAREEEISKVECTYNQSARTDERNISIALKGWDGEMWTNISERNWTMFDRRDQNTTVGDNQGLTLTVPEPRENITKYICTVYEGKKNFTSGVSIVVTKISATKEKENQTPDATFNSTDTTSQGTSNKPEGVPMEGGGDELKWLWQSALLFALACTVIGVVYFIVKKRCIKPKTPPPPSPSIKLEDFDYERFLHMYEEQLNPNEKQKLDEAKSVASSEKVASDDPYSNITNLLKWEISRDRILLGGKVGEGSFGQVFQALLLSEDMMNVEGSEVAVKTLKDDATDEERRDLINELKIMSVLDLHPNVVCYIGCCTTEEVPMMVVEYMMNGCLLDVIRQSKIDQFSTNCLQTSLKSRDLVSFARDVARGMSYLVSMKLLHRDLAARNVLVGKNLVCKVSDFGFSRDIMDRNMYVKRTRSRLPIRWLAPEALFFNLYTEYSDVWSYGILLWEIFSLGMTPYAGMSVSRVMRKLFHGYRMEKPPLASDYIYDIMLMCWCAEREDRPPFSRIAENLEALLADIEKRESQAESPHGTLTFRTDVLPGEPALVELHQQSGQTATESSTVAEGTSSASQEEMSSSSVNDKQCHSVLYTSVEMTSFELQDETPTSSASETRLVSLPSTDVTSALQELTPSSSSTELSHDLVGHDIDLVPSKPTRMRVDSGIFLIKEDSEVDVFKGGDTLVWSKPVPV